MSSVITQTPYNPTLPLQVPGLALWLDAADAATVQFSSGANVSNWRDKSGSNNNALAGTATYPIYSPNSLNGLPVIQLRASNDYFIVANNFTYSEYPSLTYFIVMKPHSSQTSGFAMGVLSTDTPNFYGRSLMLNTVSGNYRQERYSNFSEITPYSSTRWDVVSMQFDTTVSASFTLNGTLFNLTPTNIGSNTSAFIIGSAPNSPYTTFNANLDIGEILVYGASLSTAQRQQIEGYLAWKWNLQGNLPTTHPYYTNPFYANALIGATSLARSTNENLFLPTTVPGCALWLDAADAATVQLVPGTANVSNWRDKSGNGQNFTLTGTTNPTYSTSVKNGLSAVTFNGIANQNMNNSTIVFPQTAYTIFTVQYLASTTGNFPAGYQRLLNGGVNNALVVGTQNGNVAVFTGFASGSWNDANPLANPIVNNLGEWCLISFTVSGTVLTTFVNGSSNTIKTGTTQAFTGLNIGTQQGGSQFWNGYGAEILLYNSALNTAQRQQTEGYLAWKWGLQANLPTTHPFYFNRIAPIPVAIQTPTRCIQSPNWSPTSLSGLSVWLDAADAATVQFSSGANVSNWRDKSGNAKNATKSLNFPQYSQSSLNGLGTVRFNGSSGIGNGLAVPAFDFGTSTRTLFFVIRNTGPVSGTASDPIWLWPNTGNGTNSLSFQGWIKANNQGTRVEVSYSATLNTYLLIGFRFGTTAGFQELFNNGTLVGSATKSIGGTSYSNATSGYSVGGGTVDSAGIYNFDGNIAEVLLYNTALTDTQRQQVEGYLAWKWGLRSSLPITHPNYYIPVS
jgi:hypothetical protein